MNKAATTLLAPERPVAVEQAPAGRLQRGTRLPVRALKDTGHRAKPFSIIEGSPGDRPLSRVAAQYPGEALVFVEDYTPVTQYAQSLKLTPWGAWTASIAHEIRNPLGPSATPPNYCRNPPTDGRRLADIIQQHCVRGTRSSSVMQISRSGTPNPSTSCCREWLNDFVVII